MLLCLLVFMCRTSVQCQGSLEDSVRSPGTSVTDGCEMPCGCWEPKLGSLHHQQVLLNSEPSLQPRFHVFLKVYLNILGYISNTKKDKHTMFYHT